MVIKDEKIIFTNSLGDITALDKNNGKLQWQISTLKSRMFEEVMNLNTSILVENENSIYFSNNIGNFYSIDVGTGTINWTQKVNSNVKPVIINNLIFTISSVMTFLDLKNLIMDKEIMLLSILKGRLACTLQT